MLPRSELRRWEVVISAAKISHSFGMRSEIFVLWDCEKLILTSKIIGGLSIEALIIYDSPVEYLFSATLFFEYSELEFFGHGLVALAPRRREDNNIFHAQNGGAE